MASEEYEIEVSNGMKISFEESATFLMLHITFPSDKKVTFSRKKTGQKPHGSVESGGLHEKPAANRVREGSSEPRLMKSITDAGGSELMLTYGDPKDPHMP